MSDVKMEYEQTISRGEAAALLAQLARALAGDHDAEFPFGQSMVKLHVPPRLRAELEVEVEDDEVEVEIEFSWPLPQRTTGRAATLAPRAKAASRPPERANGTRQPPRTGRAKRT